MTTQKLSVGDHFRTTTSSDSTTYIVREVKSTNGQTKVRLACYEPSGGPFGDSPTEARPKEIGWHMTNHMWIIVKKGQRERKGFGAFIFKTEQQAV